ncbi:alpha/beta hydrolase [Streptomyces sp. NPDC057617]|uniref:alpha/beta hydrolase n=1 Tax=Streptomyces sp. NPDC057617 TaxID=3346184 RepID=UPI00368A0A8F
MSGLGGGGLGGGAGGGSAGGSGAGGALTWARLRDLKCSELEAAADGWGRASNRADAARDRIDKQILAGLETTQEGEAADAAVARLAELSRNFQYAYTECGLVRTTLNSLAQELRAPQRRLRAALDDAAGLKFTVHADGSVSYPPAGEDLISREKLPGGTAEGSTLPPLLSPRPPLAPPNPLAEKAQEIADTIAHAVAEARAVDARYTATLVKLTAEDGVRVTDAMWADANGDARVVRGLADEYLRDAIPRDKSPAERKSWWDGLPQEQREEYLAVYPDEIGNLDGIPSAIRDAANRDNLSLLIGELEGRGEEGAGVRLAGLRAIDEQLRAGGHPPMLLLGIGAEGNGRAIVSYGNPDTARNVSAYVPGLGTALDEEFARNDVKRARDTAVGAQKYDESSAAIVWLGYDAPQMPDSQSLAGNFAVMGSRRAEQGAPAFNSFMSGLTTTNQHEDLHLTAIGHSYGSRTVGAAAQQEGGIPGADDIVLVGSPGVGVDRAEHLGVGRDHVFVGAAENDPVTKLPSKQQSALAAAGLYVAGPPGAYIGGEAGDVGDDDLWFGKDPASKAFGARRFVVDDGPRPFLDGEGAAPAHSNYFNPVRDAESADNIGLIVSGHGSEITTERRR